MKAMTLMWVGNILIVLSIALQAVALYYPPLALVLATSGLILSAFGVPFTIWQAYRSAREQQQKDQFIYSRTTEGRLLSNLSQQRTSMHMDSQEPQS